MPQSRDVSVEPAVTINKAVDNYTSSQKPPNVSLTKEGSRQESDSAYPREVRNVVYSASGRKTEQVAGRRVIPEPTKSQGILQASKVGGLKVSIKPPKNLDNVNLSKVQSTMENPSGTSLNSQILAIPLKPKYSRRARKTSKTKQQGSLRKSTREPGQKGKKRANKKKGKSSSKSKKRKVAEISPLRDNSAVELQKLSITSVRTTTKTKSGKHVTFNLIPQVRTFTRVKLAPEVEAKEMGKLLTTVDNSIKEKDPTDTVQPDHGNISARGVETPEAQVKTTPELVAKIDAEVNPNKFFTGMKPLVPDWNSKQKMETDNKDTTVLEEGQIPDNPTQAKSTTCVVEAPDKDVIFNAAAIFGLSQVDEEDMLDPLGENAKTVKRYDSHSNEDLLNNISSSALQGIQGKRKKRKKKALKISKRHEFTTMTAAGF